MKYLKSYNESIRDYLKPKSDEDIVKSMGDTPDEILFKSVQNNFLPGIKYVFKHDIDGNIMKVYGGSVLSMASKRGCIDIVEFLLDNGADVNYVNSIGDTPLSMALKNGHNDIVELLKKYSKTNESINSLKEGKPSIFNHTIYRLPTKDELSEFKNYDLTSDDILKGFRYTIVGRGILRDKEKQLIMESIKMLCEMYPENTEYKKAYQTYIDRYPK